MNTQGLDTIAALATPVGRGSIGVVRLSGPKVLSIAQALLRRQPVARYAHFGYFYDEDEPIDQGIALYFNAPNSFTGEEVLELQGHGGPVVMDRLLRRVMQLGARAALPGEFSERAFLNNKIDLAQAEAISDLIASDSEQAASSAMRSLSGEFSKRIQDLSQQLIHLRMYVEAAIDFPEEEIDFLSDTNLIEQMQSLQMTLEQVLKTTRQGCLLRDGVHIVIAGKPNAGKSSLLNALTGEDTAIVTDVPGTTRDVLRDTIIIDGLPCHIIDTAGLRETNDQVERIGVERARAQIEDADCVLLVEDGREASEVDVYRKLNKPLIIIRNKIDLLGQSVTIDEQSDATQIALSAKTGEGIDALRELIAKTIGFEKPNEGTFIARRRHIEAIEQAKQFVDAAFGRLREGAGELVAEDLRAAQQSLCAVTGEFTTEDLLGEIFSSFCIGK